MSRMLYFIIIISFLDTFIQLPIITPYAIELGASHLLTGAIVAVYSFTNMIGNIVGGHMIDRLGRKKMLLGGILSVAIILLFYPLAQTSWQLFVVRFIHGLAGGVLIPAAFAFIGDLTRKGTRGKSMAFTGASIGFAAIVGPAIGGVVAARSKVDYVFVLVSGLFFIASLLLIKFIEESFAKTDREKVALNDFIPLLKSRTILQASLAAFMLMVSNGTLAFALPLIVEGIGLTTEATGILLSTFGIVALIIFLTPANRIYDTYNPVQLVIAGIAIIGTAMLLLHMTTNVWVGFLSMIVYGTGFAFVFPSMNRIVADTSTKADRGKAYGIFYAFFSLGVVAGSAISGFVAELWGYPFVFCGVVMLLSCVLLIGITKKHDNLVTEE